MIKHNGKLQNIQISIIYHRLK